MNGSDETTSRLSRPHEPTTMRLPGINDLEQVDTSAEAEVPSARPTRPRSTRCAPARRCWWSCAAPTPARGSCSTTTRSTPAGTPTATSSSTTSRCPASTRSSAAAGDTFVVRDVGSLNGTYVNRERIDEATLQTGDEVQIGKFRLVFYAGRA